MMAQLKNKNYKTLEFKIHQKNERNLQKHTLLNVSSSFKTSSLVLLSISSKWFYGIKWTHWNERKSTPKFTPQLISRATYFWLDRNIFCKNQFLRCMVLIKHLILMAIFRYNGNLNKWYTLDSKGVINKPNLYYTLVLTT